ncbi:A24 family peptidase C-terminal domain-containing protein [Ignicoccus hospitalis]|uniref:Peptidase A24A, prepilin type IV n=1 Tax=Ignicoccus hospitalis (strain KIN4/I / DSM 18386 / JCM 14125) TaxID=453591 RepID=A8ACC9_IGNH4|nr:A24 family peptidase C-terminal domain-containing protein [Ignicoccus hospitalis]ABU82581.1 peptidase A24A, prepilin type IV [Ignicoccus hospitalis KIN4/I]HIH90746.1 hypothetical protein [Desulfurococcaceae archaeon]
MDLWLLDVYRTALALVVLSYASYLDWKTREIPPKLWATAALLALPASLYEAVTLSSAGLGDYVVFSFLSGAIIILVLALLMLRNMMGGADVLAFLFITVDMPWYPFALGGPRALLPVPLLTLLYSTILAALWVPLRLISNLLNDDFVSHAKELNVTGLKLLRLATSARVVKVKDYFKMKFWFPLELVQYKDDKVERLLRTTFSIDEEYEDHQRKIKEFVDAGFLSEDEKIFVTYGIPFIIYITGGLLVALLIGDIPIRWLLTR